MAKETPATTNWTIKNVPAELIAEAKQAAKSQGMFMGPWITAAIAAAIKQEVNGGRKTTNLEDDQCVELLTQIRDLMKENLQATQNLHDELAIIRRGFLPLIKQHSES